MRQSESTHEHSTAGQGAEGRRRELRALLVAAADAARQGRKLPQIASEIAQPVGRAIRDRIATLISAA
jgi:hypothetical protein